MNFSRHLPKGNDDIYLNMTPLVDVVLLLLLFFMVTARIGLLPGLKMLLPAVDPEAKIRLQSAERLEISVTAQGDLYFEKQPITMETLPLYLGRAGTSGRDAVVVLAADQAVAYGQMIKIMDILRREGFNRVAFAARPEKGEPEP
jgi:biopolymer transport protein ExbD